MPSATFTGFESMDELRPHQDELLQLADLSGIHMDKDVFRSLVQLLNMGIGPDAIFNLLKILKRRKGEQGVRVRRSYPGHKPSSSRHQK